MLDLMVMDTIRSGLERLKREDFMSTSLGPIFWKD